MSGRTFWFHVGMAKSGTTYLQDALFASRAALRRQGVALVPHQRSDHHDLAVNMAGKVRDFDAQSIRDARATFAAAVSKADAPVSLYSHELMAPARLEAVRELVAMVPDHDVRMVLTVRDPAMTLSSLWQQNIQQRQDKTLEQILDGARRRGGAQGAFFFDRSVDVKAVLERWGQVIGPERTHVVVVPPSGGSGDLLTRFCGAIGVDPATMTAPESRANPALGAVQAELLRRVNVALGDRLPHPRAGYRQVGKTWLAGQVLQRQRGERLRLPAGSREWVEQLSQEWIDHIRETGVVVHGDLDEIRPSTRAFASDDIARHEDVDALLDAAVHALADILELRDAERRGQGPEADEVADHRSTKDKVVDRLQRVRARVSDR